MDIKLDFPETILDHKARESLVVHCQTLTQSLIDILKIHKLTKNQDLTLSLIETAPRGLKIRFSLSDTSMDEWLSKRTQIFTDDLKHLITALFLHVAAGKQGEISPFIIEGLLARAESNKHKVYPFAHQKVVTLVDLLSGMNSDNESYYYPAAASFVRIAQLGYI